MTGSTQTSIHARLSVPKPHGLFFHLYTNPNEDHDPTYYCTNEKPLCFFQPVLYDPPAPTWLDPEFDSPHGYEKCRWPYLPVSHWIFKEEVQFHLLQ